MAPLFVGWAVRCCLPGAFSQQAGVERVGNQYPDRPTTGAFWCHVIYFLVHVGNFLLNLHRDLVVPNGKPGPLDFSLTVDSSSVGSGGEYPPCPRGLCAEAAVADDTMRHDTPMDDSLNFIQKLVHKAGGMALCTEGCLTDLSDEAQLGH